MKHAVRYRLGLTKIESIVVMVALVVVVSALTLMYRTPSGPRRGAVVLKDQVQLEQIHQSLLIFAREFDGRYPLPGLVNRLPDPETGRNMPGSGPQDFSLNHTAPLFSMLIAQNYITPELVISPLEPADYVIEPQNGYNYTTYDPAADSYWDHTFSADLQTTSNVSYAHMALTSDRVEKYWRDTMSTVGVPLLGTRGPKNGATSGAEYDNSITLQFLEPDDQWLGNIALSDGSVLYCDSLEPPELQTPGAARPFNIFRMDGGALGISIASTENDVTRVWDPLLD